MTFTSPSSSTLDKTAGILGYSLQSRFNQLAIHLTEDAFRSLYRFFVGTACSFSLPKVKTRLFFLNMTVGLSNICKV